MFAALYSVFWPLIEIETNQSNRSANSTTTSTFLSYYYTNRCLSYVLLARLQSTVPRMKGHFLSCVE